MTRGERSPVVAYINRSKDAPLSPQRPSCDVAAKTLVRAPAHDPHEIAKAFPARWAAYIRASYRTALDVQRVFGVSERTAYRWWRGDGGANGAHVAIAVIEHPDTAPVILFAAE